MTYLYRCGKTYKSGRFKGQRCYQRRALPRKVEDYIRKPKCLACGSELTYRDKWQKQRNKETTCNCGMPIYPHRSGSHVLCSGYKGEVSYEEYEAALRAVCLTN